MRSQRTLRQGEDWESETSSHPSNLKPHSTLELKVDQMRRVKHRWLFLTFNSESQLSDDSNPDHLITLANVTGKLDIF